MTRASPSLSAGHLAELVRELTPPCLGTRVRAVEALPPRDVLLVLEPRSGGDERVRRLRLSADPGHARVHLQIGRVRRHRGPQGPFFRALAEALEGLCLEALEALPGERIVRLACAGPSATSALVLEAIGRHANLILLDADGRIRSVLVPPGPQSPAAARLAAGVPWSPPPGGTPPLVPPLVEVLPAAPDAPAALAELARLAPLSWRVESSLGAAAEQVLAEELRTDLKRRVRRRLKGARERRAGLEQGEREVQAADRLQRDGELLLAQHRSLGRGQSEVLVADYSAEGAPERKLVLDPRRSARENAEAWFARAKKLRKSAATLVADLAQAREQEQALEALLVRADDTALDPFELEGEALAEGRVAARPAPPSQRKASKVPAPRLSYRVFHGLKGTEIRVGRSARDNDELTFRCARGSDLWLHTSDSPGSHVVLCAQKDAEPDPEDVLDAAHLAVHFSPLSGARRADVHVARCKEVHKPRKAPPGLVTLSGGRTLHVRIEDARLERLLRGGMPPGRAREAT